MAAPVNYEAGASYGRGQAPSGRCAVGQPVDAGDLYPIRDALFVEVLGSLQ